MVSVNTLRQGKESWGNYVRSTIVSADLYVGSSSFLLVSGLRLVWSGQLKSWLGNIRLLDWISWWLFPNVEGKWQDATSIGS